MRMAAQRRLHFARFREPLERVGARGLEHPVTRDRIAFGQHQRLVHERAEMIERRPRIDALVARDVLGRLQREAAREDAESPEHGLLVGRQQRVAPFEGRTQCLVATQNDARTAGQQREALVQARPQPFDAEQRQAARPRARSRAVCRRGAGRSRSRRADWLAVSAKRGSTACARASNNSTAPAASEAFRVGDIGNRKPSQPIDVLVGGPERLLARYENAHLRGAPAVTRVDERRHGVRQVFAIVQHQEGSRGSELATCSERAVGGSLPMRIPIACATAEGTSAPSASGCELHPPDAIRIVGALPRASSLPLARRESCRCRLRP